MRLPWLFLTMRGAVAVAVLTLSACASATPEEQAFWAERDAHPLQFSVPAEESAAAWARAQECVAQASSVGVFPIQLATETVIQTSQSTEFGDAHVWVTVTRAVAPDGSATLTFNAGTNNPLQGGLMGRVARGCSFYAHTGRR